MGCPLCGSPHTTAQPTAPWKHSVLECATCSRMAPRPGVVRPSLDLHTHPQASAGGHFWETFQPPQPTGLASPGPLFCEVDVLCPHLPPLACSLIPAVPQASLLGPQWGGRHHAFGHALSSRRAGSSQRLLGLSHICSQHPAQGRVQGLSERLWDG